MTVDWKDVARRAREFLDSGELDEGQADSLAWIADRLHDVPGAILADEVGTGKTRIACALIHAVVAAGGRVATVVPKGLMHQWQAEAKQLDDAFAAKAMTTLPELFRNALDKEWSALAPAPTTPEWLLLSHNFRVPQEAWPWYLEAAFFWRDGDALHSAYRERMHVRRDPLCSFNDLDVIEFARREVTRLVGADVNARFFLAGGAFKSLLTGRRPRDLDLWAASPDDRTALVAALRARGGRPLEARPYSDAFELHDRIVEVPHNAEPATLEERLGRFDIGLSAVGVEHVPNGSWRAVVHPLARESLARREVRLLKPLVNWRHALATLARLRRYAVELGYAAPAEEEAEVWRVFDEQRREMQLGMIERYDRAAVGGAGVREEALGRLPVDV